jgi:hypothetical protein
VPGVTKELDPREGQAQAKAPLKARDLAGFDRALTFAEAGLSKGPVVQLGTGQAGVGIIVDNGVAGIQPGAGGRAE